MAPISRLFVGPADLSGCLFGGIYRDTRGTFLSPQNRMNHFPASPLVTVTRCLHGELVMLAPGQDWRHAHNLESLPALSVMPPSDAPLTSWSPGAVAAITLAIYPNAWMDLGGDRAFSKVPSRLAEVLTGFDPAADPETAWADTCDALSAIWQGRTRGTWPVLRDISDWVRAVAAEARLSGRGRSLRSFERHLKRLSGQNRRTLEFFSNFEALHRLSRLEPDAPAADLAAAAGYSDQSHMGRAVRRATGFSPARLNRAIETDEAFWCYRLLGERF